MAHQAHVRPVHRENLQRRRRFFDALGRIAENQQSQADRDRLVPYLQELGRAHRKFGVRERHYEVFRRALLATLQRFAAPRPGSIGMSTSAVPTT
jgi:hemoglobin-like flavoprotein